MWHVTSSSPKVRQLDTFSITSGVCTVCHLQEGHVEWSLSLGGSLWEVIQKIRKVVFQKFSMDFSDLFFCIFLFPSRFVWKKKHVHKQTENSCSTFLWERSHIKIIFPATFKWDNVIVVLETYAAMNSWQSHQPSVPFGPGPSMISVQATNQGPEVSDRSWLQLRSPFTVGSVWSSGETRRPPKGWFFSQKKTKSFFVFQRFLFKKEKASNLFQTFPVSCVQMSIFKNVFKATPKTSGFLWFFQQLEKKQWDF